MEIFLKIVAITHKILKEKLELPDYYGENLDALWDCLTGGIELPVCIKWSNYKASCHYFRKNTPKSLKKCIRRCCHGT